MSGSGGTQTKIFTVPIHVEPSDSLIHKPPSHRFILLPHFSLIAFPRCLPVPSFPLEPAPGFAFSLVSPEPLFSRTCAVSHTCCGGSVHLFSVLDHPRLLSESRPMGRPFQRSRNFLFPVPSFCIVFFFGPSLFFPFFIFFFLSRLPPPPPTPPLFLTLSFPL